VRGLRLTGGKQRVERESDELREGGGVSSSSSKSKCKLKRF